MKEKFYKGLSIGSAVGVVLLLILMLSVSVRLGDVEEFISILAPVEQQGTTGFDNIKVKNVTASGYINATGAITTASTFSAASLSGTVNSSDPISTTGTLYVGSSFMLGSDSFTGAVIAVSGVVSDNVAISHTVSTTPTYAVCGIHNSGTLTVTPYVSAIDDTDLTIQLFDTAGAAYTSDVTVDCIVVP